MLTRKRLISALLCVALAFALRPAASAAEPARALDGSTERLYAYLKKEVATVALLGGSTAFTVPESAIDYSALSVTRSELGGAALVENGSVSAAASDALLRKVEALVLPARSALAMECVFDLYWYDGYVAYSHSITATNSKAGVKPGSLRVSLGVLPEYAAGKYAVSAAGAARAQAAAANAAAIVAKYAGRSDYEKLEGYLNEICALTSYNEDPAVTKVQANDPVRVFDGDSSTNVVCGGYTKAYAYLCGLTSFQDPRLRCLYVSGTLRLDGEDTGEGHAWNIVAMGDGRNYLVDVTNSDEGMIGQDRRSLFLRGFYSGSVRDGYRISDVGGFGSYYTYGEDAAVYAPAALELSAADYGTFSDVKNSDSFKPAVDWAVEHSITKGTAAGAQASFSPKAACSKAQIITFLYRANNSPEPTIANPFTDVKPKSFYYKAALWAYEQGIVEGTEFRGNEPCTRASAVTYLWKSVGSPPAQGRAFSDVPSAADYAPAVAWAVSEDVTAGTSATKFSPNRVTTRAQIMMFLYRMRPERVVVTGATEGFSGQGAKNLFDSSVTTKWCVPFTGSAFVEWRMGAALAPRQIRLTTGADSSLYRGRSPKTWRLYGRNGTDEAWRPIYSSSQALEDVDYTAYYFNLNGSAAYRFFRLEVTETTGADVLQLSGVELVGP